MGLEIRLVAISQIVVRQKEPFPGYNQKVLLVKWFTEIRIGKQAPNDLFLEARYWSVES